MDFDSLRPALTGLIGGMLFYIVVALTTGPSRKSRDGWRVLAPTKVHHATLIAAISIVIGLTYFFWTGGSTLPDAVSQNRSALGIMLFCGLGALWIAYEVFLQDIRWRGGELRVRRLGRAKSVPIATCIAVRDYAFFGIYLLKFRSLTVVVDQTFRGADELADLCRSNANQTQR